MLSIIWTSEQIIPIFWDVIFLFIIVSYTTSNLSFFYIKLYYTRNEKSLFFIYLFKNLLDIEKDIMSLVSFSYTTVFCKQVNTGYFLISFCLGNSGFPVGDRLSGNVEQICKLVLTQVFPFSQVLDLIAYVQFKSILLSEIWSNLERKMSIKPVWHCSWFRLTCW